MTEMRGTGATPSGNVLLDISNALVGIHKQFYGRGPTKARTYMMDDLVAVVLQGGYSRAEHTLVDRGRQAAVTQTRLAMQETIEGASVAVVERLTGRKVRSVMSANEPFQELQAELFLLEPGESEPVDQSGLAERARLACEQNAQVREDLLALCAEQAQSRAALRRQRRHHL
jgi:uncharacterized protein YbcI